VRDRFFSILIQLHTMLCH